MREEVGAQGPNRLSGGDAECKSDICSCLLKKERKRGGKKKRKKSKRLFWPEAGVEHAI